MESLAGHASTTDPTDQGLPGPRRPCGLYLARVYALSEHRSGTHRVAFHQPARSTLGSRVEKPGEPRTMPAHPGQNNMHLRRPTQTLRGKPDWL
eukprot:366086-Chlamydomonas_euryale.AAC.6